MNRSTPLSGVAALILAAGLAAVAGVTVPGRAVAAGVAPENESPAQTQKAQRQLLEKQQNSQRAQAPTRRSPRSSRISALSAPAASAESEPNNSPIVANPLTVSSSHASISGSINPAGDVDVFSFTAAAGSRIWAHTDTGGTQNAGANSLDTVLSLYGPDGTTLIELDDDDGTGNGGDSSVETGLASVIAGTTLPVTGTYYLVVDAFGLTDVIDPYTLFLTITGADGISEVESNDTTGTAQPLFSGSNALVEGAINAAGDADYYTVQAAAGSVLSIVADADPERDGTGTDLLLTLFDTDGTTPLLTIDSSITGSAENPAGEAAPFVFAVAGTYFLRATHFNPGDTGTYDLLVGATACGLICPANITVSNDPNQCGAVVNYPAPTIGATCGVVTCSPPSGSFFPVGTTLVTCTATAGDTCVFTVTVNDTQPPSVTCPANVTVANDPNQCGAVVNYAAPTSGDNCPGITTVSSPPSGSFFPVGATMVTATTTDAAGNTASCSFTVTVNDTQPPSITCPANVTVGNDPNQCGAVVNYAAPTSSDNCPGVNTVSSPPSGSFFPVGTTTVTSTATDAAGNTATCTFTVRVNDTQAPTITCPPNMTVNQDSAFGAVVPFTVNASDNCPSVTVACSRNSGSVFPLGTSVVTCTATDAAGNTATCTFTVTVVPPPSTAGHVNGSGTIRTAASRAANFRFDVRATSPTAVTGNVFFTDPQARKTFTSTQITALVITGNQARIFGKGVVRGRRIVSDFVVDIEDLGRPGARRDRFRIEISDG
ncbi:MAG: hypothetical protein K0Q72_3337, partial [Armatimonadetes bacterium]|nr:hypothetical protein [Armatimonadota bacterium]